MVMDPIQNMVQRDTDRVGRALTNAQRVFGAAATIVSENMRNSLRGSAEKAELFRAGMASLTRGWHPEEYVKSLERAAGQIRARRPERWVQGLRGIPPEFRR